MNPNIFPDNADLNSGSPYLMFQRYFVEYVNNLVRLKFVEKSAAVTNNFGRQ